MNHGQTWTSGLPETVCGRGSKIEETELIREIIPEVIEEFDVKSIADAGCGDLNWIHLVDLKGATYRGFDSRRHHPDAELLDIRYETLPRVDLILCVYVLNHLLPEDQARTVERFRNSGSRYLLRSCTGGELIEANIAAARVLRTWFHKQKNDREWYFGLWQIND